MRTCLVFLLPKRRQRVGFWLDLCTGNKLFTLKEILLPKAKLCQILRKKVITQDQAETGHFPVEHYGR